MFDPFSDIREFHSKFGLLYEGRPRLLPDDLAKFRVGFLREELEEWEYHCRLLRRNTDLSDRGEVLHRMEEMLDAWVDLAYVLFGTVHLQGLDGVFEEAWRRVHEANMKKVRAQDPAQSTRNSSFDVVKPLGWEAPSLSDLVENYEV